MSCKTRLDNEIAKLKRKGLLEVIDLLLVSPGFFKCLKFELKSLSRRHAGLDRPCIKYQNIQIVPDDHLSGSYILPYINPKKLS